MKFPLLPAMVLLLALPVLDAHASALVDAAAARDVALVKRLLKEKKHAPQELNEALESTFDLEIIYFLVNAGATLSSPSTKSSDAATAPQGDEEAQEDFLEEDSAEGMPGEEVFDNVYAGNWAEVKRLIDNGAPVHIPDLDGLTLLHYAAMNGNDEAVLMLLAAGADKNVGSEMEYGHPSPYEFAKNNPNISREVLERLKPDRMVEKNVGEPAIISALRSAKEQNWQQVNFFLIGIPEKEVNTTDREGRTLLHYAAIHGDRELVAELLKKGLKKDLKDKKGKYPYDYSLTNHKLNHACRKSLAPAR